ncbi:radical SAM protein [bacterium]|nr:radical SAM protein [bacterium]
MGKITRFFKFVHDFSKGGSVPRIANYEITSRCNLKCEHCYWMKNNDSNKELSDEQWTEVFTEHQSQGVAFAFLSGGEPTLRLKVIESADRVFNGLSIASNGVIKVPERIRRRLFISIDGPREVHDRIRGAKVFDRVVENITGDKRVLISPTLSKSNFRYIDELVGLARKTGVAGITFSLYTSHDKDNDPLLLSGTELDWTLAKLSAAWKSNRKLVFMTPYIINLLKEKQHHHKCLFKGRNIVSYSSEMQRKTPCVLGTGVNCATCGCIVPMVSYALTRGNLRSWLLLNRMFPKDYFHIGQREEN